jgi:TRAP-type mannitol/chloroaromatic compound transport system permease small subunit
MLDTLLRVAERLEAFTRRVGLFVAPFIFVMIVVIMIEVVGRYFFNRPTPWAHDISGWLQVAYVFLGGAYALQRGYLVRVDVIYASLPRRLQAAIDLTLGTVLFAIFAWVMVTRGYGFALQAWRIGETSATGVWSGPLWPAKAMVPVGTALLVLGWIAHLARQVVALVDPSRVPPEPEVKAAG